MSGTYRLGVDVGGTFTDLLLIEESSGQIVRAKVPTTPKDPSQGVINGIRKILGSVPESTGNPIRKIMHGTTIATNAILERKGAKVALVTTEGFRQTLQIERSHVPGGLGSWIIWPKNVPLAPLDLTIEAFERIDAKGNVVKPVDADALRQELKRIQAYEPQAVTVCLINSFANGSHEEQVRDIVHEVLPGLPVSISSEVLPELGEFERTLTTVANSYVRPQVASYLSHLASAAEVTGSELTILRSDGGLDSVSAATSLPVNLLMSGPAGGVAGVTWMLAKNAGYSNLLTLDMGGTSTDVCLIEGGLPRMRRMTTVGDLTVRASSLDVKTVGAGGGSIASVPELTKALRVGPSSAGAVPGPAAYGHGGTEATVTDANVVLGYLPAALLGGDMKLDVAAATAAVDKIATELGVGLKEAAAGIIDIVNENMFGALRLVSVEQGYDPRNFALVGFGGAGPLHANALGKLLNCWPVIIPPSPGLLCAYGDATTQLRNEAARTFIRQLSKTTPPELISILSDLAAKAAAALETAKVAPERQETTYQVEVRYHGQGINLPIPLDLDKLAAEGVAVIEAAFHAEHEKLFTFRLDVETEVVNLRAVVQERPPDVKLPTAAVTGTDAAHAVESSTHIWYEGAAHDAFIYTRAKLATGNTVVGPAIIVEDDSTTLVLPAHHAVVDGYGNLLVRPVLATEAVAEVEDGKAAAKHGGAESIQTDIIENALRNIRFEMDGVLFRTAMSPGIREQHDEFPMIADAKGRMVVGQFGSFLPGFLDTWKGTLEDGDVIFTNDPYSVDGAISHANDWLIIIPIFWHGTLVSWASMFGHMTDVGGKVPGSLPTDARTIYEEGVLIPPVKLYDKGQLNQEVLRVALHPCRMPHWNKSDLNAVVAACRTAERRIKELCGRFGVDVYTSTLEELLARNRRAMFHLIKTAVPDEKLYFEDYVCDDGIGAGPYKLACTMWKQPAPDVPEGLQLHFDFTGTDPQSEGSINFYLNSEMFKMFVGVYMIMVFDPQILFNDGFYPLIAVHIPDGSLLKPRKPAALSCRTHALSRIFDIMGGLLGQRNPQFMTAAGFSDSPHLMYSGYDSAGDWFQLYQIGFGGIPGRPFGDGPDGHSLWPSFFNVPNEFLEAYFPLIIERSETVTDSGGPGLFRGGNGIRLDYRFLEPGDVSIHDDRWLTYPWGVNGGLPGARSSKIIVRGGSSGKVEFVPSKCDNVKVSTGDVLQFITWGGGGWGDPLKRDAELVATEVRRGLISVNGARRYGVVLTAQLTVDEAATSALRAELSAKPAATGDAALFNRGFDSIDQLKALCLRETGLAPPAPPKFNPLHTRPRPTAALN